VLTLLTWSARALGESAHPVPPALSQAITRIAPALRALRHADGELARFHGGGMGQEGRLDQALAAAGARAGLPQPVAMGFARLTGRRTSVIIDASPPPGGRAALTAHASTAAFELTSGRRALIVSCGSGADFGPEWHRAARATPSHSVLTLDASSSSRLGTRGEALEHRARVTASRLVPGTEGTDLYIAHDGWEASHGLTAGRSLTLSHDGRRLLGVETLTALTAEARRRFDDMMTLTRMEGRPFPSASTFTPRSTPPSTWPTPLSRCRCEVASFGFSASPDPPPCRWTPQPTWKKAAQIRAPACRLCFAAKRGGQRPG
jgi:uncharacterized heparinase superfamily protein